MPLLEARALCRRYTSGGLWRGRGRGAKVREVLRGVSFALEPGARVALLGRSGEGKSTLSRVLLGLERPDSGQVLFHGRDLHRSLAEGDKTTRMAVQVVFQNASASLNPGWTAARSIAEPLRNMGFTPREIAARVERLLAQVELPDMAEARPGRMSGGQLQRICLARALAPGPELLILDEAVSGLDMLVQARMLELLGRLCDACGLACLLVTHDVRLAAAFCDRMLVLHQGRIVLDAASPEELRDTAHPAVRELVEAVPV